MIHFDAAIGEMNHFGLSPAVPFAVATLVLELGAAILILIGYYRWLAAVALAVFTFAATFVANRFWDVPEPERFMVTNAFFEHLGLAGAFVLVAWHDLHARSGKNVPDVAPPR